MLGGTVKKILKNVYNAFVNRRNAKKAFICAKRFLFKGIYYIPFGTKQIRRLDRRFFKFKNLIHMHIYINKILKGGDTHYIGNPLDCYVDSICFGVGQGKIVLMTEDTAYGFYNTEKGYSGSKNNYDRYYAEFNYPCINNITFNDDFKCIVMDRVFGVQHNEAYYHEIVVKKLLELSVNAAIKVNTKGEVLFLQHGDASPNNILWNGVEFCFIDLDNMNYYPPLLDVFHYFCCASYSLSEIVAILNQSEETVKRICERARINVDKNYLDELFYCYIMHYVKMNCCFEDFKFLTSKNTVEFPMTNEILRSINA